MRSGPTRKLDYEKAKRQKTAQNLDYLERFAEEGNNYDRGGIEHPKMISFRGSKMILHLGPRFQEDQASLVHTLERHWKFTINGEIGTIARLRKNPKFGQFVEESFEIMRRSILRADTIIGVAEHPKTKRQFRLVEFRCPLRPLDPFPNPVFKGLLAFKVNLVGPALTETNPNADT